jgi:hypothetical protein
VNYVADPDEFLFILKVPEAWRLLFPIPVEMSDEDAMNLISAVVWLEKKTPNDVCNCGRSMQNRRPTLKRRKHGSFDPQ